MHIVVSRSGGDILITELDGSGAPAGPTLTVAPADFPQYVRARESASPRWVWDDTAAWYPELLRAGIRVERCHDLRLSHVILCNSAFTRESPLSRSGPHHWDEAAAVNAAVVPTGDTLFDFAAETEADTASSRVDGTGEVDSRDPGDEFQRQVHALTTSPEAGKLRLLLAAESAGALIAAEMQFAGLPWRTDIHDALLTSELGPRVAYGTRPVKLEALAARIRSLLDDPTLNPDSQTEVLRALKRAGLPVRSTRAWELKEHSHPALVPLLEYKKLSRLLSANGWYWMDTWIIDGRFHPDYVPGGVVTGRWATKGGGALQLPKQVRRAVTADDGWTFVVADASQLEPRILAALSTDLAMADAGRGTDLYAGIVASGVVETREHAKVAMLGAMYGATSGESGRLLPKLARAYPRALELTEAAARVGERGGVVSTRLGRSSPRPSEDWLRAQAYAYEPEASSADERMARSQAREWGRFTRNFVVQGSAAEWALCWMAQIRKALQALDAAGAAGDPSASGAAAAGGAAGPATSGAAGAAATFGASGAVATSGASGASETGNGASPFSQSPHLVFFLHDEVVVHTPAALAPQVHQIIVDAATEAGRLLFGDFPVDFLLTVATVESYADAK